MRNLSINRTFYYHYYLLFYIDMFYSDVWSRYNRQIRVSGAYVLSALLSNFRFVMNDYIYGVYVWNAVKCGFITIVVEFVYKFGNRHHDINKYKSSIHTFCWHAFIFCSFLLFKIYAVFSMPNKGMNSTRCIYRTRQKFTSKFAS